MDRQDIPHRRLHNLRLEGAPLRAPEDAVGWLCAVQSQDFAAAKWSLAQRTGGVGDADLDRAFAAGAILRTHVLRPTWHFVLPADIRWLLELTAPRVHALSAYQYRQLGLDEDVFQRSNALLADALAGGVHLTRKQLGAVLERGGVALGGFRLAYLLMNAELRGVVCSGAPHGRQQTYALLEERAPPAEPRTREEALAELTLRYFTSHGPATVKDFGWWSSLTAADIRRGLELVGSRLRQEVVDGVAYWSAGSAPPPSPASPTVHLLQGYDEYLVGYSQSKSLLNLAGRALIQDRPVFNGVAILDGQVAGHWKRTVGRGGVAFAVALYEPFDDAQAKALQAAADRQGEFLGVPATVATTAILPPGQRADG
jgi:Winged helix DNA-binding domain